MYFSGFDCEAWNISLMTLTRLVAVGCNICDVVAMLAYAARPAWA
jgi:hypothetical protein